MSELRRRGAAPEEQSPEQAPEEQSTENTSVEEKERKSASQCSYINRFIILIIAVLVITAISLVCWHFLRKTERKPHVLLLIADDLGWADVGWHSSDITTPTLTALAQQGVILSHFYSQPICTASRAALFTGRYPFKLGLQGSRPILAGAPGSLPLNTTLLPELMKKDGYRTHLVGKWHLGFETIYHTPVMRGFDTFTGFYNGMQDYYTHTTSGFDAVDGVGGYDMRRDYRDDRGPHIDNIMWGAKGTYSSYIFTDEATKIIEDHHENHEDKPLFLVMSYPNPHSPIQVPDEFVNAKENAHIGNKFRRTYAGLVYAMDCSVAKITSALKEKNMMEDTIVIFISDNGGTLTVINQDKEQVPTGSSNYPLRGEKGGLWEAGSRVPAFIYGKNLPKGEVVDAVVHITDIYPTLASYLDLDLAAVSHNLDGADQSNVIKMETTETAHEYVIYDIDPVYEQAAIRYGKWKLILGEPAPNEVNGRYQPLTDDQSSYDNAGLEMMKYVTKAYKMIGAYKAAVPPMCTTVSCFFPGGTKDKVQLYDLSVDEFEFNDVASQNPDVVSQLLAILDKEMVEMIAPVNLLEQGEAAASPDHFNGTWMPWL